MDKFEDRVEFDEGALEVHQPSKPTLNSQQEEAVSDISDFIGEQREKFFFLLKGYAGTGKTFSMQEVVRRNSGRKLIFTAPTNKATKVLRETLSSDGYRPQCRTIYSLLGLRMEANGEIKELAHPEDPVDLRSFAAVVVDEASMVNKNLWEYIQNVSDEQGVKFLFMGDDAQLPPVGEKSSEVWGIKERAELTKVMRHDNQILALATKVRRIVDHPAPSINFSSDYGEDEGVWKLNGFQLEGKIREAASSEHFSGGKRAKVIAWRNTTVDDYNALIRRVIFPDSYEQSWVPEDRIVVTEPVMDFTTDEVVAHTDDEGTVEHVSVCPHPIYPEYQCWKLAIRLDDNKGITVWLLHDSSQPMFNRRLAELSAEAKAGNRSLWKYFWDLKQAFHYAKHAYAITAHRSQGSTYEDVYVDWRDILINKNRQEAFRCFYVALTRPKKRLFLG